MVDPTYRAMLDSITKPYDPRELPPGRFWNAIAYTPLYLGAGIGITAIYFSLIFLATLVIGFPIMVAMHLL